MIVAQFLKEKLGVYKIRKDEWIFRVCPFCNNPRWNFQVCLPKGVWHCWACNRGGGLKTFLRRLGYLGEFDFEATNGYVLDRTFSIDIDKFEPIGLVHRNWEYFEKKGISIKDLDEWRARVYKEQILFPFFEDKEIVFWVLRDMLKNKWYHAGRRDIPIFKNGNSKQLVIVEGIPDGIKAHKCGFSVLVLLGRNLNKSDKVLIKRGKFEVILCLDGDTTGDVYKKFIAELGEVKWVDVYPYDDPSDMKLEDLKKALENAKPFSLKDNLIFKFQRKTNTCVKNEAISIL